MPSSDLVFGSINLSCPGDLGEDRVRKGKLHTQALVVRA